MERGRESSDISCCTFVSLSGMYQRLDKMRKNAFASVCLFGTDNNSSISGIWVWRGQELAFEVSASDNATSKSTCVSHFYAGKLCVVSDFYGIVD